VADFYRAVNEPDAREFMLEVSRQNSDYRIGLVR